MKIPVANIYYLLAYAWDKLEASRLAQVNADVCNTPIELLAQLLANGTTYLFKKGLDRNYDEREEMLPAIKGKLLLNESLKNLTFQRGEAVCRHDELSYDVLHNRILKTTLLQLQQLKNLDPKIVQQVRLLNRRFHDVSEVKINKPLFKRVHLHRNNHFYAFLLHVCELLYDNLLPDERSGGYYFREFWKDEAQMPALFEAFVRNFYKRETVREYQVSREYIRWQFTPADVSSADLLPQMQTDITLRSANRKIIIDTKYYKDIFTRHYGVEKLRREHISQLFSYLKNQSDPHAEGILLYATAVKQFRQDYTSAGHRLAVRSVDLSQDWSEVRRELLQCVQ